MTPFKNFSGLVAPLDRPNVDTDQIIPKQFLKGVGRSGLGGALFFDWRFTPGGGEDPDFSLNSPRCKGASILVARANFGCGSSREHAVWALGDYGFRAVVAPSFADIFRTNCLKNGLLPVMLRPEEIERIFRAVAEHESYRLSIELEKQAVADDFGWAARFELEPSAKKRLLEGLDDVALTMLYDRNISAYEAAHPVPYAL